MLFEINIKDPKEKLLLKDVFFMDSITELMDVATAVLETLEGEREEMGHELSIRSQRGTHIICRLESINRAMQFKYALYDHLMQLQKTEFGQIA
ncbi:MAG: hypothetical protein AAF969_01590 [Bacteroidota bacterium]